ncbi:unnamed protein product [Candidula unifasciata]|uniref:F-box domain-containing protein n=1 Tax=Candidula unifasciata TaxID=100452 RepID=A0A8S4A265_9EUPU|nr:unnamed protein product [Candidula unifasciata]
MSVPSSPRSEMTLQQSKCSTEPKEIPHKHQHPYPHKKSPLVRKLSSNPCDPMNSATSSYEEHSQAVGLHSYSGSVDRIHKHFESSPSMPFPESYTSVADRPSLDESDEDEDEGESSNDEKQNGLIGLGHCSDTKSDITDISTLSSSLGQVENSEHQSYPEVFSAEHNVELLTSSAEFIQTKDNNNYHQPQHLQQHCNYNDQFHLQQEQIRNFNTGRTTTTDSSNAFGNKINGYKFSKNENEIYSLEKESHTTAELHQTNGRVPSPPKSKEINSWAHFHKPTESNYRYRRSHYSSESEEEDTLKSSKTQHKQNSKLSAYKPHQCHYKSPSPSEPSADHRSNGHRSQTCSSTEKQIWTQNGIKPQEFKERFVLMKKWFSECNDGQKNLVMKGLLGLCEWPQLHLLSVYMSKELHHGCPSNCEDLITWLPRDLALKVMSYLDPVSLCHAAQVCRVWRQLAEDQSLWCRFCCQTKWRLSKAAEHKQVISHMCPEGSIQWKNVFAERFRLRNNWLKGRCTVRTFEGHLQGISCVQFDDSRIVSGSSDKTIKVWNMRTNAPWSVQTLMGHHGTVRCLYLEGNRLVSGSCDKTIKVWDLSTQDSWSSIACKVTMVGHTDTVRCLQADDDKVISGSYDTTLKIWDLKSGTLRRTLRGHQASVLCVHFSETKIVSGSADKTIKVWSYDGSCMMTLRGHQDAVTCLMFDSTRIVSGSLDHNLKFWDIHTGECLNTIDWKKAEGHTDVVRCLQADSWRVVSAADDKTIKVWNLATGERLVTLRNHTDGVTCLQFNDFIIVSGSYDKSVKLWDFSCC